MRTQIYPLFCKRKFTLCWGIFFPQPSGSSAWGGIWLQDGRIKKRGLSELLSSRVPLDLCLENVFFSFFQFFIRRQWLYNVVSFHYSKVNHHTYIHILSLLGSLPIQVSTVHKVEFPVLSSMFSLVISSTQCQSQSHFLPCHSNPPHFPLSIHLFLLCLHLYFCLTNKII